MYQPLVPCPWCARHVRADETSCPFCKSTLSDGLTSAVVPAASSRLSRAAAFAFTASIAVTGCASGTTGGGIDSGANAPDTGGLQPPYGHPPHEDADAPPSIDAGAPDTSTPDDGGLQAAYGAPPQDARGD